MSQSLLRYARDGLRGSQASGDQPARGDLGDQLAYRSNRRPVIAVVGAIVAVQRCFATCRSVTAPPTFPQALRM